MSPPKTKSQKLGGIGLNYLKFKDFLVKLGLLTEGQAIQTDSIERHLLYDIWRDLNGEQSEQVRVENARVVI